MIIGRSWGNASLFTVSKRTICYSPHQKRSFIDAQKSNDNSLPSASLINKQIKK